MITTHMEIEEIETQAEELHSFLLMLEQALENGVYKSETYVPGVMHLTTLSGEMMDRLKELKEKYTKLSEKEREGATNDKKRV